MSWIGGSFWISMLHELDDNARSDILDDRRFWWSLCGHMCVVLPPELDISNITHCETCFPNGHPAPRVAPQEGDCQDSQANQAKRNRRSANAVGKTGA